MIEPKAAKLEAAQFAHDALVTARRRLEAMLVVEYKDRADREAIAREYGHLVNWLKGRIGQYEKELAVKPEAG